MRTPDVLVELNWPIKKKYPSYLEVNISFHTDYETHPKFRDTIQTEKLLPEPCVITHFSRYPWEREVGLKEFRSTDYIQKRIKVHKRIETDLDAEERVKFFKLERIKNESCKRPNKFYKKLDSEELGAFRIKFSNNGDAIAVACTFYNSRTIIKIYNTLSGHLLMKLKGHHDLIHDFEWSRYDNILCSASADGSVKVWNVSDKNEDIPDKLDHNENDKLFFLCELVHPSYVYAVNFYKEEDRSTTPYKIIATACYDQTIKFWMFVLNENGEFMYKQHMKTVNMLNLENVKQVLIENQLDMDFLQNPTIADYIHPNCMVFDRNGRLYVGDSIGLIRVWDVSYVDDELYLDNYFIIKQKEIEDDTINNIMVDPNDEDNIIVHSRDS